MQKSFLPIMPYAHFPARVPRLKACEKEPALLTSYCHKAARQYLTKGCCGVSGQTHRQQVTHMPCRQHQPCGTRPAGVVCPARKHSREFAKQEPRFYSHHLPREHKAFMSRVTRLISLSNQIFPLHLLYIDIAIHDGSHLSPWPRGEYCSIC
jgi:hypothetical protein